MPDVVIENPVLNSPYVEPTRHFRFSEDGITNEVVEDRRSSIYYVPIPKAKKRVGQLALESEWTEDRIQPNKDVDRIRARVGLWRRGNFAVVTPTTQWLLYNWANPQHAREARSFISRE